jgi:hypothetical protein
MLRHAEPGCACTQDKASSKHSRVCTALIESAAPQDEATQHEGHNGGGGRKEGRGRTQWQASAKTSHFLVLGPHKTLETGRLLTMWLECADWTSVFRSE